MDHWAALPCDALERFALHDLVALYAHLVDHAAWSRLAEVFTDDAVCDFRDFVPNMPLLVGLPAITTHFSAMEHPIAHHAVNTLVTAAPDPDTRSLTSKLLIVMRDREVYVGEYRDVVVRSAAGWRFAERRAGRPNAIGSWGDSPFDDAPG